MIRGVLGSRASIGGVLGSGRGGAASLWWLSGGVSAANCVVAYQPIGAASLAASYVNLANPGTYNAAPGVAPTFAAATGWTFARVSAQHLTTGIIPAAGWSMIVRLTATYDSGYFNAAIGAGLTSSGNAFTLFANNNTNSNAFYQYGGTNYAPAVVTSGVMGLAASSAYLNGSLLANFGGTMTGTPIALVIGARNNAGTPEHFFNGSIQALAIYNTTLTATQIGLISTAMAAL